MDYLDRYHDVRRDPRLLLEGARTMVCCAFAYTRAGMARNTYFADYALGEDYHRVLRRRLKPVAAAMEAAVAGSATRICVDTAPLRERYWAQRAGIGFVGLNNQLIVPGIGSAVFLAEVLWTASVKPDEPCTTRCAECGACMRACPGKALDGLGGMDARRCLSYLTIEHRGDFDPSLRLSGRIYGCDICRDVCPLGRGEDTPDVLPEFEPSPSLMRLSAGDIASMDEDTFGTLFARSAIKRTRLEGLLRNVRAKLNQQIIPD